MSFQWYIIVVFEDTLLSFDFSFIIWKLKTNQVLNLIHHDMDTIN